MLRPHYAALLLAFLPSPPAGAVPGSGTVAGTTRDVAGAFKAICAPGPGDIAGIRKRIAAYSPDPGRGKRFERAEGAAVESYVAWPVQLSVAEADGFVTCLVLAPVPRSVGMEDARAEIEPLVLGLKGPKWEAETTPELVTWQRATGTRGQRATLNLAAVPGGKLMTVATSTPR